MKMYVCTCMCTPCVLNITTHLTWRIQNLWIINKILQSSHVIEVYSLLTPVSLIIMMKDSVVLGCLTVEVLDYVVV